MMPHPSLPARSRATPSAVRSVGGPGNRRIAQVRGDDILAEIAA